MLTIRGSAALLGAANSIAALTRVARQVGFLGIATALDADARTAIGAPPEAVDVSLVEGHGSLRALVFTLPAGSAARDVLSRLASRLHTRAPQVLWLLIAGEADGDLVAIAAPSFARRPPRVAALLARRGRITDSDAETLRLLSAAASTDDLATHARFIDILGRDALSRRFFRALEECVNSLAASASTGSIAARNEIALLYASRLLFLAFLESKGWLNDDAVFLVRRFDDCMERGGGFHARVLLPLFFGTLNTPQRRRAPRARAFGRVPFLNGGLFTRTPLEKLAGGLRFDDEALGQLFVNLLTRYRFTALEETASFEEAAIDPEMLGRTFECLMAARSRQATGAFYTPHELVARVTHCGLEEALRPRIGDAVTASLLRGEPLDVEASLRALDALRALRVLDPACGSGAFLVHVLDRVASLCVLAGDSRPAEAIRRQVLATSVFGVDVNPTAVWLCQLRLWLSIVIETRTATVTSVPPLPNLDRNIRVGDSLAGEAFDEQPATGAATLRRLRERYVRASGARKASLSRRLDREERRLLVETTTMQLQATSEARRDLVAARRGRDLFGGRYVAGQSELRQASLLRLRSAELRQRLRSARLGEALPFSFPVHFADVAASGGFSLVVGNPPWVRPHRMDARMRDVVRQRFAVARQASWTEGATAAGAGRGFASQVDLAALFVERSLQLLAQGAALSLLLPTKLWRSLAGGGLRRLLVNEAQLLRLEDYTDVPASFDAAVYPGLLVTCRGSADGPSGGRPPVRVAVLHRERTATAWIAPCCSFSWDETAGSPWILIPPDVRRAFDRVRAAGVALASSRFGRPLLGVKCGLNDAYLVTLDSQDHRWARVRSSNGREGDIEVGCLRPVLRGERIRRWATLPTNERIIWPHDERGHALPVLPPGVQRWLSPMRRSLLARTDARSNARWWSLFRTDGALNDVPRVAWADIGRSPRATVLDAGDATIPLNSCYVARCPTLDDALALAALLNSPLVSAWLSVVAEPARGGYRRYLGWTMALLPVPAAWDAHRDELAGLSRQAVGDNHLLLDAVVRAFELTPRQVEPLLTWATP